MLAGVTGRGIRIAVVDSGVHAAHPHIVEPGGGGVVGGVWIDEHGAQREDVVDRLGHGTAVTAAIRERAPDAAILVVKVFDRALATSITSLVAAIDWSAERGVQIVNLSLGTPRMAHREALSAAVDRAARAGTVIVSARDQGWLPGCLPGVIGVAVNWDLPRDRYRTATIDGALVFEASGFAREIPGVPPARNLHGVSLAVANMTGFVARAAEAASPDRSLAAILTYLQAQALVAAP